MKTIAPPAELQRQHEKLSAGMNRYQLAVQGYVDGLSAYSFPQIRASQTELETAEGEIKAAANDFQQAISQLMRTN